MASPLASMRSRRIGSKQTLTSLLMNEGHRGAQRDLERLVVHGLGADGVGRALAVDVVVAAGDVGGHEGVGEAVVGVAQAHDGVNVVLRGDGLAVGPLVVAQVERVDHAVIGHVVGLAAGGLDVVDRAVEVERAEQALMHVAQHDELVGVAHVVDVEGLQVVVLQVELLDGVGSPSSARALPAPMAETPAPERAQAAPSRPAASTFLHFRYSATTAWGARRGAATTTLLVSIVLIATELAKTQST